MKRTLIVVVVVIAIAYVVDLISVWYSIPHREQFGSVTVHTYYAVKLKNGRTEYDYAGDHVVSCTNSLFPQLGNKPCWYAARRTSEQISIDSGTPNNPHIF